MICLTNLVFAQANEETALGNKFLIGFETGYNKIWGDYGDSGSKVDYKIANYGIK